MNLDYIAQRFYGLWMDAPSSILEILIFFLLIYTVLKFLESTRGAAVLRGILLFLLILTVLVFFLARFFDLAHVIWVYEKLATVLILAALIVFQPELRRGLLRMGEVWAPQAILQSPTINEIAEAAIKMSQRSVGALIAIERTVQLRSYLENSTPVNAEINSRLIQTIFHPGSPLHDGGVLVKGNTVAAAQCIFPLSESQELSKKNLGTRHRAALGLSEQSDAVIVVVSEETGRISLAHQGQLIQGLSPEELRRTLNRLCLESVEGGG
jgi:diadenylate cyclase